ncbi:MAG: Eco57I restriction-modification methylase domain-containing protein [Tannerellaceae bacterium]|jgi:hypothetical protein|nr:Eco57I restriction-modification methylase domain-containing protein [Tannerellaceae bacterium]
MSIHELVEKYVANRESYLDATYNETLSRSDFLDPFFELLGWDIKNHAAKPTNQREVILEEGLKANVNENTKKPDYTFRLFAERKFFLEAKKPSVSIQNNNETAKQVRRYGYTAKLKISVLSNFEYLLIYDCSERVDANDVCSKCLVKSYHYTEYIEKFDEIKSLLGRQSVYSGEFDKKWKNIELQLEQHSIDRFFLLQINNWRQELGAEIYKYRNDITGQLLNDWVQNYLNRILFLRVCEDRNIEQYQSLLKLADHNDFIALLDKFREADRKYNSGLFDQPLCNEIIQNISSVFWHIIRQLYYPESPYSFSILSSDILGNIYEIYLTERLTVENGDVILKPKPENIDRDIITTPAYIINEILRQTVIPYVTGKTAEDILSMQMADIACGSGAFLLELFQLLQDTLVDYYLQNDSAKLIPVGIGSFKLPFEDKKRLLTNCIYGADKDFNAVEATKFGLLLKLLEDEDYTIIGRVESILPDLANNIYYGNSLIKSHEVEKEAQKHIINPFDWGNIRYDIIVGNPPYMKSEDMQQITPYELPIYKRKFKTAYKQFDKYYLFIEQSLELLKEDGLLGYIIPGKFTKVGAALKLRTLLQENKYIKAIVSFGANQVFNSKTTYTCLLIAGKQASGTFDYSEVKKLFDWKIAEKGTIPVEHKSVNSLDNEVWALVAPEVKGLYDRILFQSVKLEDIVGETNIYNGIQTSANRIYVHKKTNEDSQYVYFILDEIKWKIEKELTRPYYKTSRGEDHLSTYHPFQPNSFVIYPYKRTATSVEFIKIDELKKKYPFAYSFFIHYKEELSRPTRDIKPYPETVDEWYRYGRHQNLVNCDVPGKIIVGVLSVGNKYAIDFSHTLVSSGGTAGYCMITPPDLTPYSIYYIQAILNSKYVEWFASLYGEVFRGGYIARGTKVLKRLPIRKINFDNTTDKKKHDEIVNIQQELIRLQGEMDKKRNSRRDLIPLQRTFERQKDLLENTLKNLYGLGVDDDSIPLISELFV